MLRTLIVPGLATLALAGITASPALASCAPDKTEALYSSDRSCPEQIRKVSCDGASIDLMASGPACCPLKQAKSVNWRCGTDEALKFKCKGAGKGADFLSIQKTADGLAFICLGQKPVVTTSGDLEDEYTSQ